MNKIKNQQKIALRFLIHLLALGILFVLPEVMMTMNHKAHPVQWHFYAKALVYVGVFYTEYFVVLRGIANRHLLTWRFFMENIGVIGVVMVISWLMRPPFKPMHDGNPMLIMFVRDLGMVVLTMALAVAMKLSERIHAMDERKREMDSEHRREELKQLKSQLNPHFLFNALNTIYALTEIDASRARTAVHTLSRMLRYALYEADRPTVALGRELEFIADYVNLMEIRLAGSMSISTMIECPESTRNMPIAPMLFISLIENAFKHGVTGKSTDSIVISIQADQAGNIMCEVTNSVDLASEHNQSEATGVGIANLQRRLELIYEQKASLTTECDGKTYKALLSIADCSSCGTATA